MTKPARGKHVSGNPAKRAQQTSGSIITPTPSAKSANQDTLQPEGDIKVFLSYTREDESSFHFISQFKDLLTKLVHAKTGRKIATFLDTSNIKWGDKWRDEITSGILGATVFIPLLSANYLESPTCRDEFNAFYSAAKSLVACR